ncbi:MAG: AAA family ATPase, partial [Acidimicrobiia bacterium]
EEFEIVRRMGVNPPEASAVLTTEEFLDLQRSVEEVYVDPRVADYAVRIVLATRYPNDHALPMLAPYIAFGASPRASLGLVAAGRALALMRGRNFLLPQDVFDIAPEVLRHRIVMSYEALADGITVEQILDQLLGTVGAPRIVPGQDESAAAAYASIPAPTAPGVAPAAYPSAPPGAPMPSALTPVQLPPPMPTPNPVPMSAPSAEYPPTAGSIDDLTPGPIAGERPAS